MCVKKFRVVGKWRVESFKLMKVVGEIQLLLLVEV